MKMLSTVLKDNELFKLIAYFRNQMIYFLFLRPCTHNLFMFMSAFTISKSC